MLLSGLVCIWFHQRRPVPRLNIKTVFPRYGILMLVIRRSWYRLIFNTGIPILVRWHLYIETAQRKMFCQVSFPRDFLSLPLSSDLLWLVMIWPQEIIWTYIIWFDMNWSVLAMLSDVLDNNVLRCRAHIIVSWTNPRQWLMINIFELVRIIRWNEKYCHNYQNRNG